MPQGALRKLSEVLGTLDDPIVRVKNHRVSGDTPSRAPKGALAQHPIKVIKGIAEDKVIIVDYGSAKRPVVHCVCVTALPHTDRRGMHVMPVLVFILPMVMMVVVVLVEINHARHHWNGQEKVAPNL